MRYTQMLYVASAYSLACYVFLCYFFHRSETIDLFVVYAIAFALYLHLYKTLSLKQGIALGALFRFSLLLQIPNLSDDYFRFLWDGHLWLQGINPFEFTPRQLFESGQFSKTFAGNLEKMQELYQGLNSKNYHAIYPPLNQWIFAAGAFTFKNSILGSVIIIRLFLIAFEFMGLYFAIKLLNRFEIEGKRALLYWINPLVILEISGNLHFEGAMIACLFASVYFLHSNRFFIACLFFALAISAKLLPIMFLQFFIRKMGLRKSFQFGLITAILFSIFMLPFLKLKFVLNFFSSIQLYFRAFEFNASIHYIVKTICKALTDYNLIRIVGPIYAIITLAILLIFAKLEKSKDYCALLTNFGWVLCVYFILSAVVHPWYIVTILALFMFSRFRFVVVWSGLIFLTYFTYRSKAYEESMLLIALEYVLVLSYMIYELVKGKQPVEQH